MTDRTAAGDRKLKLTFTSVGDDIGLRAEMTLIEENEVRFFVSGGVYSADESQLVYLRITEKLSINDLLRIVLANDYYSEDCRQDAMGELARRGLNPQFVPDEALEEVSSSLASWVDRPDDLFRLILDDDTPFEEKTMALRLLLDGEG
jgi:hypothetical protein